MKGSKSRSRQTRGNPLRNSARYENAELAAAIEESKRLANKEKKNALHEELAFHRASEESRELKELQNSEAIALELQAIENKQARNAMEKQKHSNYKLAKKLQNGTLGRTKTNAELARNLQLHFNREAEIRSPAKVRISAEESKESEPPPRRFVSKTVRLPRTRSKTIARPRSANTKKVKRWWKF
jgi:hypothetical protein